MRREVVIMAFPPCILDGACDRGLPPGTASEASIGWLTQKRNPAIASPDRNFRTMPPRASIRIAVAAPHFRRTNVYWK
jgi:hypothetical protein